MQFRFSDELEMTRAAVRDFAENEVAREAGERDERERFDRKLFGAMGSLGLTGIPWPERFGGAGSDCLTYAVAVEELARVCASTAAALAVHTAYASWPIFKFGSEELKRKYLTALASGAKLGAASLENGLTADADGDGFVLNGSLENVANAGEAYIYFVFAEEEPVGKRRKSACSAFIVESGTPGLTVGKKARKLGLRSVTTCEISFDRCRVPAGNRLGKKGQGREIVMSALDYGQISASALAVGVAQGAMEAAAAYAKERNQFGKPIGRQQGISFKLADMAAKLEGARLLAYQAAWRQAAGLECRREAALAGKFASAAAAAVTIEAVQVFGGYGYMREYRVERYMRDAKCIEMGIIPFHLQSDVILHMLGAD
jgi:butyryl-CoA dehydrogenase